MGTDAPETEELQLQFGIVLLQGDDLDRHSGRMEVRQIHFPKTAAADNLPDASPQLVIVDLHERRPLSNHPQGVMSHNVYARQTAFGVLIHSTIPREYRHTCQYGWPSHGSTRPFSLASAAAVSG